MYGESLLPSRMRERVCLHSTRLGSKQILYSIKQLSHSGSADSRHEQRRIATDRPRARQVSASDNHFGLLGEFYRSTRIHANSSSGNLTSDKRPLGRWRRGVLAANDFRAPRGWLFKLQCGVLGTCDCFQAGSKTGNTSNKAEALRQTRHDVLHRLLYFTSPANYRYSHRQEAHMYAQTPPPPG